MIAKEAYQWFRGFKIHNKMNISMAGRHSTTRDSQRLFCFDFMNWTCPRSSFPLSYTVSPLELLVLLLGLTELSSVASDGILGLFFDDSSRVKLIFKTSTIYLWLIPRLFRKRLILFKTKNMYSCYTYNLKNKKWAVHDTIESFWVV